MMKKEKLKRGGGGGGEGEGRRKLNDSKYNPVNKITHVASYEITLYASNTITS